VEHKTRRKTDTTITPLLPASQYEQEDMRSVVDGKEGAIAFIGYAAAQAQAQRKPFFMVLSLTNPHDVLFHPQQFAASGYAPEFLTGDIGLPASVNESLATKTSASRRQSMKAWQPSPPASCSSETFITRRASHPRDMMSSWVICKRREGGSTYLQHLYK